MIYILMPIIFLLGIICIALEDTIKINKAAVAIGMCIVLWNMLLIDGVNIFSLHPEQFTGSVLNEIGEFAALPFAERISEFLNISIVRDLGDVAETLFFVMASMVIIDLVDVHGGFSVLTQRINTQNKRRLLWIIAFMTFFLSALLGNLATVIVVVAMLRKLVFDRKDRLIYTCMAIIAANAGGSFSPIGDVTTLLLWTGKNISAAHQVLHVFPASMAMMILPLAAVTFMFPKGAVLDNEGLDLNSGRFRLGKKISYSVLTIGLVSLIMVPVLQSVLGIPPFLVVLGGLVVLWCYTDVLYRGKNSETIAALRVNSVFSRIDMATILFFLGILMSVAALRTAGQLGDMSAFLDKHIGDSQVISFILGLCSSFLDNVALVAGTMGMYPIAETGAYMADGSFWTFLAYCAVTGGSILIIGSASGVTVMGMEKIPFMYYFKRFSALALVGYVAGALVFTLLG